MTEIEKIEYAKAYIDKLANGINPLTDQPIPDHELLNHVRISRCLFYVSDVLRQVAENGGIGKPEKKEKKKKQPFHLSAEDRFVAHSNGLQGKRIKISVGKKNSFGHACGSARKQNDRRICSFFM